MDVFAWITAAILAGPSYYLGVRAGRRLRGQRVKYLAWSAVLVLAAATGVMFLSRPAVVVCFGFVFALQLGMRHAYGPLTQLIAGEVAPSEAAVPDGRAEAHTQDEPAAADAVALPTSAAEAPPA